MRLADLAHRTGATSASIKYWIRAGVLAPGRKSNATTAVYDEQHIDRIALIQFLRTELRVPMSGIAELTALIDDPEADLTSVQERCQVLALGLHRAPGPMTGAAHETISALCAELGWPDLPSWAREELAAILDEYPGVETDGWLRHYAKTFDAIARDNVTISTGGGSRDRIALDTLSGVTLTLRVEKAISAMAHASASIARRSAATPD